MDLSLILHSLKMKNTSNNHMFFNRNNMSRLHMSFMAIAFFASFTQLEIKTSCKPFLSNTF